jgi:hypothetical protein
VLLYVQVPWVLCAAGVELCPSCGVGCLLALLRGCFLAVKAVLARSSVPGSCGIGGCCASSVADGSSQVLSLLCLCAGEPALVLLCVPSCFPSPFLPVVRFWSVRPVCFCFCGLCFHR